MGYNILVIAYWLQHIGYGGGVVLRRWHVWRVVRQCARARAHTHAVKTGHVGGGLDGRRQACDVRAAREVLQRSEQRRQGPAPTLPFVPTLLLAPKLPLVPTLL